MLIPRGKYKCTNLGKDLQIKPPRTLPRRVQLLRHLLQLTDQLQLQPLLFHIKQKIWTERTQAQLLTPIKRIKQLRRKLKRKVRTAQMTLRLQNKPKK